MGTNQEAVYTLCQLAHPLLAAAKGDPCGSAIVMISSVAGGPLAGRAGSLYAMSKAALNQLAKNLACEWAGDGIRVNSVAPWVTLTEMGKQVRCLHVCMFSSLGSINHAGSSAHGYSQTTETPERRFNQFAPPCPAHMHCCCQ